MSTINLQPADLTANRKGHMSATQCETLHSARLVWSILAAGLVMVVLCLIAAIYLQLWLLIPLFLFWMWLLRRAPFQIRNIKLDLREQQVAFVDDKVRYDFSLSPGLIRFTHYHLIANGRLFHLNKDTLFQFKNQEHYRVYFAPLSGIFLGAIALDDEQKSAPPSGLLALFSEQELKIVQLIAQGLSNKEIAAALHLSTNTIKVYNSQIYEKLGVSRRTEAVAHAREIGLLQ